MATTTTSHAPRTDRVRTDILVGASLIAVATLGRLLWLASDAGLLDTFGTR
ncbi:MAG: hypothetical protein JWQ70_1076 [Aeromicrobium sp.]|nr:hypothetical protein [Aeromicrobium sp.]